MQTATDYIVRQDRSEVRPLLPALFLMGLTLIVTVVVLLAVNDAFADYPYLFLVPWVLGLGVVMAVPSVVLYYQGKFSFANPIVFATFSYFLPAFVIGGLFFAAGLSRPVHAYLIQDASYNLPLTVVVIALTFTGLAVGYFVPIGEKIGSFVTTILPGADYRPSSFVFPGLLLLGLGVMNTIIAFAVGLFGFQKGDAINSYDGLIYLTTLYWMQASFILWFILFRQKKFNVAYIPVVLLLLGTSLSKALFAGNRGSILSVFTIVSLAYILAGRQFRLKQGIIAAVVLTVGIFLGIIYGTTFRNVKGTESQQDASQYTENIVQTFDQIGRSDVIESISFGFANLAERIDVLSVVAVVVSNYEQLLPYEEAYGLNENIWIDLTTFIIPRVIWPDKPYASDPRRFSDLYFNNGDTSFGITPAGDLIRNYGLIGVPIGMFVLGIILRASYRAFVEGATPSVWRNTLYFMLLTSVSYEGFYGTIIPSIVKVCITAVIGLVMVTFIAKQFEGNSADSQLQHQ
jgi:hypothetical protein